LFAPSGLLFWFLLAVFFWFFLAYVLGSLLPFLGSFWPSVLGISGLLFLLLLAFFFGSFWPSFLGLACF
jgi:fucose 4-O-acetylase-like acetyltransferase